MAKVLKKSVSAVDEKMEAMKAKLESKAEASAPIAKGSLAPEAPKAVPAKAAEKKPAVVKADKKPSTVLPNGLTYSLLSRVRNAYTAEKRKEIEAGAEVLSFVDGRGRDMQISSVYVKIAEELGGAEYLKGVRTSHVRTKLFPKPKAEVKAKEEVKPKAPKKEKAPAPEAEVEVEDDDIIDDDDTIEDDIDDTDDTNDDEDDGSEEA
jgi:hypothetical protein